MLSSRHSRYDLDVAPMNSQMHWWPTQDWAHQHSVMNRGGASSLPEPLQTVKSYIERMRGIVLSGIDTGTLFPLKQVHPIYSCMQPEFSVVSSQKIDMQVGKEVWMKEFAGRGKWIREDNGNLDQITFYTYIIHIQLYIIVEE